ncbi:hypothetical protein [Oricola cellulosilytica]|uniref:Uncharacterized protein n=1 Tax=Oricola cellulosilytica TaxID=1429082 RepID=A0A4R0PHV5_9HYPH|nr:hypothetical protein [Oricola cellulosilytica]TCD15144.1 hypothetical protein E0D97_06240 [Oricola cellulosilytica]
MELVGGLAAKLIGGIGAGVKAATGAAGAAAGASGSGGLFTLKTISTTFGVVSQIGRGIAAQQQQNAEARQQQYEAREEFVDAKETSAALKAELANTIANQKVLFASGGVNLGSVSVEQAQKQAVEDAESELSISSNQSLARSLQRRRAARNARSRGRSALFQGFAGAAGTLANAALDRKEIGA